MVARILLIGLATLLLLAQGGSSVAWSADVVIYPVPESKHDGKSAPRPAKRGGATPSSSSQSPAPLPAAVETPSSPGGTYKAPSSPEFSSANSDSPSPRSTSAPASSSPALPSSTSSGGGKKNHTVKKGDDLSSIADKYGVTVDAMRKANKLAKGKALTSGQVLVIPPGGKGKPSSDDSQDNTSTAGNNTDATPAPTGAPDSNPTPYATHPGPQVVTNAPEIPGGDVALRPPAADPAGSNGKSKGGSDKDKDKTAATAKSSDKTAAEQKPRRKAITHKVGEGETLRSICKKYGANKDVVYKLSGLKSYTVKYGQTLVIRAGDPEPSATASTNSNGANGKKQPDPARETGKGDDSSSQLTTLDPADVPASNSTTSVADSIGGDDKEKEKQAPQQPQPQNTGKLIKPGIVHTVGGGETLRGICSKYGVAKEQIKELNNLSTYNIRFGQVLRITPDVYEVKKERNSGGGGAFSLFGSSKHQSSLPIGSVTDRPASPGLGQAMTPTNNGGNMRLQTTQDSRDIDDPSLPPKKDAKLELGTMPSERDANGKSWFPQALKTWQKQMIREAAWLSKKNIRYCGRFTPPGEAKPWMMDCSNTARLLYKRTTGMDIGRTASDQYYYLHLAQKAWEVPYADDKPSADYLRRNLRVGDLLFWEHTYKPERTPPITHVTIFLGYAQDGQMLMAGSQTSSYGSVGRIQSGGPDIYVFNPFKPSGGYYVKGYHQRGRFIAIGRPVTGNVVSAAGEPQENGKKRREG
ncbi:MAG: LysM peptidoglycan-binding domain-containing protein [Candidatus Methylacidiphilales bacterium]